MNELNGDIIGSDHSMYELERLIGKIEGQLHDLPGWEAQAQMATKFRPKPDKTQQYYQNARQGAVLILLYPSDNDIKTTLIQRPVYEGVHSGQIAFPGGKKEEADADLITTALREANEEVNIDPGIVKVVGSLTELYIPPSNFLVTPIVGFSMERPDLKPDDFEVASILEVTMQELTDPNIRGIKAITPREGITFDSPYYNVQGHTVWGATAMMISELNAIIAD